MFCFFFLKLNKTTNILYFYFFLLMENLGAMADSRYSGFHEITDRDVLDLYCIML